MVVELMANRLVSKNFVIAFIAFVGLLCFYLTNAMGSGDYLKTLRDSGIIGEKKTLQKEKIYYEPNTGSTFHFPKGGTFVTPKVIGDVAYFDLSGNSFKFACLGWKYSIKTYWSSPDVTEERVGFSVSLESPDKKIFIDLKEIDIPVSDSLFTPITQEQIDALQFKTYVEDPLIVNERILAAQQSIKWILEKGQDNYNVTDDMPIKFTSEQVGNKEFVKAEVDIFSKKENVGKKCLIWALNYRGYRLKNTENVRRMYTWICQVITNSSDYSSAVAKAHMILETFKFHSDSNAYPDLKN